MRYLIIILNCFLLFNLNAQNVLTKSEKAFSKIKFKEGFRNETLTNDFGNKYKVQVYFPKISKKQNKLIIALHGGAHEDAHYKYSSNCLIIPSLKFLDAIIVTPQSGGNMWWTENNSNKVISIVENAQKYWNVDPNKIAVVGYSDGGTGSWHFADKYPEYFSAAIPLASNYSINRKIDVPLYVIHGEKDKLFPVSYAKKQVARTIKKGSDVTFVINEEYGHRDVCSFTKDLKKAGFWLENIWEEK